MKYGIIIISMIGVVWVLTAQGKTPTKHEKIKENQMSKSNTEWKEILTEEQYQILREKGTERAFTGKYDKHYENGDYVCAGCGEILYSSETKYDSGCGWPAFSDGIDGKINQTEDYSFGMIRTEITCANCGGHLGHIFNDGPQPTGIRHCVNSASLNFKPKGD